MRGNTARTLFDFLYLELLTFCYTNQRLKYHVFHFNIVLSYQCSKFSSQNVSCFVLIGTCIMFKILQIWVPRERAMCTFRIAPSARFRCVEMQLL